MQTLDDIEIIVVDNDDTEETAKVVKKIDDGRIKHFRTGNLSMPDNWEFGTSKNIAVNTYFSWKINRF